MENSLRLTAPTDIIANQARDKIAFIQDAFVRDVNDVDMSERIEHDIIVLADSDIRVQRDYLSRLVRALDDARRRLKDEQEIGLANDPMFR